jgi:hypothetical protein
MNNIELLIKIASAVAGTFGIAKILYDILIGKRGDMREEYAFAQKFFAELTANPEMHPFVREKGYQAIASDRTLETVEIEYLLTLKKPDRALKDYVLGRNYLEHLPNIGNLQIAFKDKYKRSWTRYWRKTLYLLLYFALAFLAFAPLFLFKFTSGNIPEMFLALLVCLAFFGPSAWFCVTKAGSIYRAEKLVQHQHKHSQIIFLQHTKLNIGHESTKQPYFSEHKKS